MRLTPLLYLYPRSGGVGTQAHVFKNDFVRDGVGVKHIVAHLVVEVGPFFHSSTVHKHVKKNLKHFFRRARRWILASSLMRIFDTTLTMLISSVWYHLILMRLWESSHLMSVELLQLV